MESLEAFEALKNISSLLPPVEERIARGYVKVTVLNLYFDVPDDNSTFKQEAGQSKRLFEESFNYEVINFGIPLKRPYAQLVKRISEVSPKSDKGCVLFIIHYGGHGFVDNDCKAVWAAFKESDPDRGDPTFNWSDLQKAVIEPIVQEDDVLLILDCCNAGAAMRNRNGGNPTGRFEIIAAASHGELTPDRGSKSFTSVLLPAMAGILRENAEVEPSDLTRRLASYKDFGLLAQPIHSVKQKGRGNPIMLKPLKKGCLTVAHVVPVESVFAKMTFQMKKSLSGKDVHDFTAWLATTPSSILGIVYDSSNIVGNGAPVISNGVELQHLVDTPTEIQDPSPPDSGIESYHFALQYLF